MKKLTKGPSIEDVNLGFVETLHHKHFVDHTKNSVKFELAFNKTNFLKLFLKLIFNSK